MNVELTQDAELLLCVLYNHYLEQLGNGKTKSAAKQMGSAEEIFSDLLPEWKYENVLETCWELKRAGMLDCKGADNTVHQSFLTDKSIIFMEKRFKNRINDILDTVAKIKSILF